MITVTKTTLPSLSEYSSYLDKIWQSNQLTNNGPLCIELADKLSSYLQTQNLVLVTNGTIALQLAIKALDLSGEIITTPYSYVATTNAILWENCEPIFVDIDEKTFCINPDLIEAAITEKTTAILATHVYGYPCDVYKIQKIADKHNLKVIYDAAHAFGVKLEGRSLLEYGDCSTLSFHATKLFHSAEGGAVVCKNQTVSQRISLMKKFGHLGEDEYLDIGINAKLSELHAAMGLAILPRVSEIMTARQKCSAWYEEYLDGKGLQRPLVMQGLNYNYAYYPVVFPSHEVMMRVRKALMENGIGPRRYFHPSLNRLPFLKPKLKRPCQISESISERVLSLPLFVGLEKAQIQNICRLIVAQLP